MASSSGSSSLLVAAIDFGTTYSGYAFSFKHEFDDDPLKVSANTWTAGSRALVSLKTPTTVLLDKNKKFHAFGYEAEDIYSQLADDDEHEEYYYFRRFKMMLFDQVGLKRDITLKDIRNRELPALDVFSEAIKYLKNHLIATLKKRASMIDEDDIQWVLTVPAIWNDAAKQFMREAAEKAGIDGEHLRIALEPEAASLYCRHLPIEKLTGGGVKGEKGFTCFKPNSKYLVLDCGGGTIDITVHEVQKDGSLKELDRASGGAWGGTQVDESFKSMLIKIVGNPVMLQFTQKNTSDYVDMFREFETKKRCNDVDRPLKVSMKIPVTLKECFEEETEEDLNDAVLQSSLSGKLEWKRDKLRIQQSLFDNLFSNAIDNTIEHVRSLLDKPSCAGTDTILMVGGFSEAKILQNKIKEAFSHMRVVIPSDAGLAVLKGAVIFGHCPTVIKARKAKYTYGVLINTPFDSKRHKAEKKIMQNGKEYCDEIFSKHVTKNADLEIDVAQKEEIYYTIYPDQKSMVFKVFTSELDDPVYTDKENKCSMIGEMKIDMSDTTGEKNRSVKVRMIFGGTELKLEATDVTSNKTKSAKFNFLD